jgi:TRAP-type C4-dicarboxylate transport system permease large subunit
VAPCLSDVLDGVDLAFVAALEDHASVLRRLLDLLAALVGMWRGGAM